MTDSESDYQSIDCPYCGESIEIYINPSVPDQEYIEDCQVCCRPITMRTQTGLDEDLNEIIRVTALHENAYQVARKAVNKWYYGLAKNRLTLIRLTSG